MQKINLAQLLLDTELKLIKEALEHTNNHITNAARLLGIKRTTLREKMNRFKILVREKEQTTRVVVSEKNIEDQLW